MKMLSYKEKKARIIDLNNDVILVKGHNHVGKSCILKSFYRALGAGIKKMPTYWDSANVILLLYFSVDGIRFKSMLIGNEIQVFNPDGNRRFKAGIGSSKLNTKINELFDLQFHTGTGETPSIPVGAVYMPFYIDQDDGWTESWTSFVRMGNATEKSNYRQYLTNVVDSSYFVMKHELTEVDSELSKARSDQKAYQRMSYEVLRRFKPLGIDMSLDKFNSSIKSYLQQLSQLRDEQKSIIGQLHSLYTRRSYVEVNIAQLKKNIKEMEKDFAFAVHQDNIVTCPTCGASYQNDMLSRHEILKDVSLCKDQVITFQKELESLDEQIESVTNHNTELLQRIASIQSTIKRREDKVTLEEVIEEKTRENLLTVIEDRQHEVSRDVSKLYQNKETLEASIKYYEDSERKKLISKTFESLAMSAIKAMGSSVKEDSVHFGGKIVATGSSAPIHVIAYMFAYLKIMCKYNAPLMMPIVVDEPGQQGLNTDGQRRAFQYMRDNLPQGGQLIVSFADSQIDQVEGVTEIDVDSLGRVLCEEDYESVKSEIEDLLEKDFFCLDTE